MFLKIEFGDNDFGRTITDALSKIWEYVYKNNIDYTIGLTDDEHYKIRTMSELFERLYKSGALLTMICMAVDCEYNYKKVEWAASHLYYRNIDWEMHKINEKFYSICDNYLKSRFKISFHEELNTEWNNGEITYLNLETGECNTY